MARLEPTDGGLRLQLAADEVDVVASLAEGLAARLEDAAAPGAGPDDAVVARLTPEVSRGDAEVDAELRALLRGDLLSSRVGRLRDLIGLLRSAQDGSCDRVLDRDTAMRIVESLNDVRVALAATVGYDRIEGDERPTEGPAAETLALMDALGWLQGGLIEFVMEG